MLAVLAALAILFGLVTIISGGNALFGGAVAREAVGDAVPFVLWFNFLVGPLYVATGFGLFWRRPWAVGAAWIIAIATIAIFAGFGIHIWQGGAYEARTVGAMSLRSVFWIMVAWYAGRRLRVRGA